jgi:hypothetical protein
MTLALNQNQLDRQRAIETVSKLFGVDPAWTVAIALTESALGEHQKSPTGCLGVFQMSSIAMKDLLQSMEARDDDLVDIVCGVAFLRLLLRRWGSIDEATKHFCDPNDRGFYIDRVHKFMSQLSQSGGSGQ